MPAPCPEPGEEGIFVATLLGNAGFYIETGSDPKKPGSDPVSM